MDERSGEDALGRRPHAVVLEHAPELVACHGEHRFELIPRGGGSRVGYRRREPEHEGIWAGEELRSPVSNVEHVELCLLADLSHDRLLRCLTGLHETRERRKPARWPPRGATEHASLVIV